MPRLAPSADLHPGQVPSARDPAGHSGHLHGLDLAPRLRKKHDIPPTSATIAVTPDRVAPEAQSSLTPKNAKVCCLRGKRGCCSKAGDAVRRGLRCRKSCAARPHTALMSCVPGRPQAPRELHRGRDRIRGRRDATVLTQHETGNRRSLDVLSPALVIAPQPVRERCDRWRRRAPSACPDHRAYRPEL